MAIECKLPFGMSVLVLSTMLTRFGLNADAQTLIHNSDHFYLIALLIIKETEGKHLKFPWIQFVYIFGTNPGFTDMQPGVHMLCQLRGQVLYGLFQKLILQRWMITSTAVHLIPQEKRLLWALSEVILSKDICSAPNLTPLNSFWDLIISSPVAGPQWGQIHLTLFFLVSQVHRDWMYHCKSTQGKCVPALLKRPGMNMVS